MSATTRRGRTREKSNVLYHAPGHEGFDGGVFRINERDTSLGVVHEIEPSEVRFLGRDMAAVESEFGQELPKPPTPASGDPYDDCGEKQPLLFCDRCGEPHQVPRRCRRSVCPDCWESWVKRQTVEMCAKINGRQRAENAGWGANYWMHHVTLSPPVDYRMRSEEPLDRTKEAVKQILTEGCMFEGVIIYHPWRIDKEHRGEVLGHDSGNGDIRWKHVLAMIEEQGFEAVKEQYLTFAPHFHAFGISPHFNIGDSKAFHRETGWIVERIADSDGASVRELPDLCRAVGYSLSHAGLREDGRGMAATSWYFGETAGFEATEGIRADTERAFNAVSETILGASFRDRRCTAGLSELVEENDGEGLNAPTPVEGGGGGGRPPEGEDPDPDETCNGRLRPIRKAPQYLADDEWREGAPYAAELVTAYTEFRAIEAVADRPPPDPPPA